MNKDMSPVATPLEGEIVDSVKIQMDFFDALKMLADGKKITRLSWNDENVYGFLERGEVCIMKDGLHTWVINDGDLTGEDWVIV